MKKYGHSDRVYPYHDPGLTEEGKQLAKKLGEKLHNIENIYCSPFKRARETAVSLNICDKITIDTDLQEFLGFQKPIFQFATVDRETRRYGIKCLGCETLIECKERAIKFYEKIKDEKNVCVVTHGILLSYIYQKLTNEEHKFEQCTGFAINNGEITLIQ